MREPRPCGHGLTRISPPSSHHLKCMGCAGPGSFADQSMKQGLAFSIFLLGVFSTTLPAQTTAGVGAKALAIHTSAIVIDTNADTPQRFLDGNFDIGSTDPDDNGHITLNKARAGNLGAEFFSIWVDPRMNQGHFAQHRLALIDSVYQQAARHPDRMMMAFNVPDIERAHKGHKVGALM